MRRQLLVPAAAAAAVALSATSLPVAAAPAPASPAVAAPGAPGSPSYFDQARKDCVGTSTSGTSKVWFTVADGQLSDVYEPTVDNTNVKSLQWVVTNGRTWTDIQARDMTYTVRSDPTGMSCTVTAADAAHGYRLTTTYFTDPSRDAVVAHTTYHGPPGLAVYARLEPLVNGDGGGGSANAGGNTAVTTSWDGQAQLAAYSTNTTTEAVNRNYAVPTYEVLSEGGGLGRTSVGYAGTASDGATALDTSHQLPAYTSAPDGHVALTARVRFDRHGAAELALGFGRALAQAQAVSARSAGLPAPAILARYVAGWVRYDASLRRPSRTLTAAQQIEYYRAVNVVKASEDKTFPGAIVAGLASPWGQSVPAGVEAAYGLPVYFGSYREVFARDLYEAFTALLVAGDMRTAQSATRFLFDDQQQADGSMPRNSLVNGKPAPDTGGLQLDETAYPILMAWQSGLAGDHTLYQDHVRAAADFLVAHGPADGVERWEEQSGYSPSTIAAEIAGLTAASAIAAANHDPARARLYQATADDFARRVKGWTVTTVPDPTYSTAPYFIRIAPDGNPNDSSTLNLGNGAPSGVPQQHVIDAGFLELVRLGVLPASDPTVANSVAVVDRTIAVGTPSGPGFYRYGTVGSAGGQPTVKGSDGYGDCYQPSLSSCSPPGAPWPPTGTGTGHPWPVLSGERGEYDLASGDASPARDLLQGMMNMGTATGIEPEQVWEDPALPASPYGTDPAIASIGFVPGAPDGSAAPLTWAEGQYARLAADIGAGRTLERPDIVADRYVHGMPAALPLTIGSPAPGSSVAGSTVTVTGTTAPGATVDVEGWDALSLASTSVVSTTADRQGAFSVALPVGFGQTEVTATATAGRATGYAQTSVSSTALPGTPVFAISDPTGDDNGPGTYAYPTAPDFQPGAFDLTGLQVNETTDQVYLTVGVANLAPTFGNAIGAQLFDLYVRDPAATATSTAAAYPSRNYTLTPGWSERIEVQGFASPQWVSASGTNLGAAQWVATPQTGRVTIVVPRSTFGSPGPGWSFVVALTGQNGFSADQARGFTPTPGSYTFGVCSVAETQQSPENPICTADPGRVPEAMDVISGGNQAQELDPLNPDGSYRTPVISGLTVP